MESEATGYRRRALFIQKRNEENTRKVKELVAKQTAAIIKFLVKFNRTKFGNTGPTNIPQQSEPVLYQ